MKPAIATNFRGWRAVVIHRPDENRQRLAEVLARLGLEVRLFDPGEPAGAAEDCDLILFDADDAIDGTWPAGADTDVPVIAVIGNEAPSRLARVVCRRCDSHILKPVRSSGIFPAVLLAVNGHQQRRRTEREIGTLRQRLAGRRMVMKAVLRLMAELEIDEETAYEGLRREAMDRRLPIEDLARERLGGGPEEGPSAGPRTSRNV
jgi:AmiR/NasT family two-component response regulator